MSPQSHSFVIHRYDLFGVGWWTGSTSWHSPPFRGTMLLNIPVDHAVNRSCFAHHLSIHSPSLAWVIGIGIFVVIKDDYELRELLENLPSDVVQRLDH